MINCWSRCTQSIPRREDWIQSRYCPHSDMWIAVDRRSPPWGVDSLEVELFARKTLATCKISLFSPVAEEAAPWRSWRCTVRSGWATMIETRDISAAGTVRTNGRSRNEKEWLALLVHRARCSSIATPVSLRETLPLSTSSRKPELCDSLQRRKQLPPPVFSGPLAHRRWAPYRTASLGKHRWERTRRRKVAFQPAKVLAQGGRQAGQAARELGCPRNGWNQESSWRRRDWNTHRQCWSPLHCTWLSLKLTHGRCYALFRYLLLKHRILWRDINVMKRGKNNLWWWNNLQSSAATQ